MKNNSILFFAFFLITGMLFAQSPIEKVQLLLQEVHEKHPEIGISLGLRYQDKTQYSNVGTLNRNSELAINEQSIFEIASITKALTGNLIAQAIQEGKIKPNDYIDIHLPKNFRLHKTIQKTITISDLASHQSGLPDIDFPTLIAQNPQQPVQGITKETITTIINTCTGLKDHGQYRYSTIGFILLGQILEQLYGQSYDTIIRKKIILPLELKRTLTTDFNTKNITSAYNPSGGTQELFNWNITAPAGLVKSSAADMMAYLSALSTSNGVLHEAAVIAEKSYYKDDSITIGLGINILSDELRTVYAKTGDTMGQSSVMAYDKDGKWALVIFMNQRNSKLRNELFNAIYEIL